MKDLEMNPWLSIWVKPRKTLRAILAKSPNYRLGSLSFIYGVHYLFYVAQFFGLAVLAPAYLIVIAAFVLAIPVAYCIFSLSSFIILLFGKLLGGKGCFTSIRCTLAWCAVPNVINIFLWLVLVSFFGNEIFMQGFSATVPTHHLLLLQVCVLLQLGVFIWALVILINGLAEVQGYSVWMGLLNLILGSIVMGLIFYGVGFVIERL